MEAWATVVIVLVSNAIIGAVSVLTVRKQLKQSAEQFKMEVEARKEEEKRERRCEVRDEALVRLRDELARMGEKLRTSIDLATQIPEGVSEVPVKVTEDLERAVGEWDTYTKSGDFVRTLNMQYDHNVKVEALSILTEYQSAYMSVKEGWIKGEKEWRQAVNQAKDVMRRNDVRISEVQSKIIRLREEL